MCVYISWDDPCGVHARITSRELRIATDDDCMSIKNSIHFIFAQKF